MSDITSGSNWIQKIIDIYSIGGSDVEVCAEIRCTMDKFMELYNTNDAFKQAIDLGRILSKAWWYRQGRENLNNRNYNSALYNFQMKNRFGWSEKGEATPGISEEDLDLDTAKTKALAIMEKLSRYFGPENVININQMKKALGIKHER
ncbi:MAG: hypothetical protein QW328_06895 [Nitrososphaerota archaeon]